MHRARLGVVSSSLQPIGRSELDVGSSQGHTPVVATTTIFATLGLGDDDDTNRRLRAVLAYLNAGA